MECIWGLALLIVAAVPLAALVLAVMSWRQGKDLGGRLEGLEVELSVLRRRLETAAAVPERPAEATVEEPAPPPAEPTVPEPAPFVAPEPAPPETPTEPAAPSAEPAPPPPPTYSAPAPPRFSLREIEKSLGARLPVWIGAVALALSAAFLVKISFDRGWLGPPVRVALGVVFGVALLAAGEKLRASAARVAVGLTSAGVAVLFVSFYAGVNLYALIAPLAGFLLMALTTATAVALSLRQGPMVAVLGLVGGFLTPYLVSPGEPDPKLLFLYLLLLQVGLVAVSRRRGWWPLAALSYGAGLLWLVFWLTEVYRPEHQIWLGLFVLVSVALFAAAGASGLGALSSAYRERAGELNWAVALGGLAALAGLALRADYGAPAWLFLALLAAGCLVLGRLEPRFHALAWVGAGVPAALMASWIARLEAAEGERFGWTALALGALFAIGAWAALWRSPQADRWGWLSAAAGVGYLLLAFWGASRLELERPWGVVCLALALVYLVAALPVARRRARGVEMAGALAALAVAVTAFVSLAVPIELEQEWLAVAWALEVAALVWLAARLEIPILVRLAWVLAAAVVVRLLLNPGVLTYPIGEHPLLNWLVYGYGVPLAAFAAAARMARRQGQGALSEGLEWGALGLGTGLVTLLVRQWFHPGEPGTSDFVLAEWGTLTVVWLLIAWGLLAAGRRWPRRSFAWFARALAVAALAQAALGQGLVANPVWSHQAVGSTPVVNLLLWVYGLPAALLVAIGRELSRKPLPWLGLICRLAALLLLFVTVTLEVRQAFRGTYLDRLTASGAEQYAYSAAWIVLGLALLAAGIAGRGRLLRFASLAVMLLAVGKVFLYDMGELKDFYRVFSFLGLGLSLLFIAWLYQRFVFRE